MLQVGERLGPYEITGQLGQGGMATVYKAYHAQLDRYVAIKMIHQALQEDSTFLVRFQREAQIVAKLEHPHIVPVYDYSEYKGQPYLVMKFIEGDTLKSHLNKGVLPLSEILPIMTAVGSALTYAHHKGVLHRDVKPSNIVIDTENVPYLTDFGLARIAQAGESTMSADVLLGTPLYISPEQARGQKNLDGRADIYSLGVVLYELVVGRLPFSGDTPFAIMHNHIYSPLPLPSMVNPEISPHVQQVLVKALAKMPAERYATADDLVKAFRQAVETDNVSELSASRASVAAASLARIRDQEEREISYPGQTPARVSSAAPSSTSSAARRAAATPTPALMATPYIDTHPSGRLWLAGGMAAFLLICFLSTAISLSAVDNLGKLRELGAVSAKTTAVPSTPATPTSVPSDQLYAIPTLSAADAQANLTAHPDDPTAYLALTKAYWTENTHGVNALDTLRQGFPLDKNQVIYTLSAADAADKTGHPEIAAALYVMAFDLAEKSNTSYPFARALAGQYLYTLATLPGSARSINAVSKALELNNNSNLNDSTLMMLATARDQITQGRLLLAERTLSKLSATDKTLPETYLIQGDLILAEGSSSDAKDYWNKALAAPDTPDWVKTRASQEIKSTGQ